MNRFPQALNNIPVRAAAVAGLLRPGWPHIHILCEAWATRGVDSIAMWQERILPAAAVAMSVYSCGTLEQLQY